MLGASTKTMITELNALKALDRQEWRRFFAEYRRANKAVSNNITRAIPNPLLHGFWSTIHIFQMA